VGDNSSVLNRVITPADCVLAFGIPTSADEFNADLERPGEKDYAPHHVGSFLKFRDGFLPDIQSLVPAIAQTGLKIRLHVTLEELNAIFSEPWKVIIVFTHWARDPPQIELADRLHNPADVVAAIGVPFRKMLEFSVCNPAPLALKIAFERPDVRAGWRSDTVGGRLQLWFYLTFAKILLERRSTFATAIDDTLREFNERGK
jgi:hypothetical protein